MHAERLPVGAGVEQLFPLDLGGIEIAAQGGRQALVGQRPVVLVDEDLVARLRLPELLPGAQGAGNTGVERPSPRIGCLVFVQRHDPAIEVDIREREVGGLAHPAAFAGQEREQDPAGQWGAHVARQGRFLGRVQEGVGRRLPTLGHEPAGQGARRQEPAREHRQREHPMQELRVRPARAWALGVLRQIPHDHLGVVEGGPVQVNVAEGDASHVDRADFLEPLGVDVRILLGHVVGVKLVQFAARPALGELGKRHHIGRRGVDQLAPDELASDLENAGQ